MTRTIVATSGLALLLFATLSLPAPAEASGANASGCEEITQTYTRDTGRGHGHEGTWTVWLPDGYALASFDIHTQSANPRRKTYDVRAISDERRARGGVRIDYDVPHVGNHGAARIFGDGERSWLTLRVVLNGQDCSRPRRPEIDLSPPEAMLDWLDQRQHVPRDPANPRRARDHMGVFLR